MAESIEMQIERLRDASDISGWILLPRKSLTEMIQAALATARREMLKKCAGLEPPNPVPVKYHSGEYLLGWDNCIAAIRALGEE